MPASSWFNYCLVFFGISKADPGVANQAEAEYFDKEDHALPEPRRYATSPPKNQLNQHKLKNHNLQPTEWVQHEEHSQHSSQDLGGFGGRTPFYPGGYGEEGGSSQPSGQDEDQPTNQTQIESPSMHSQLEPDAARGFSIEKFKKTFKNDGFIVIKHNRRGKSKERILFSPNGTNISWLRSAGSRYVASPTKVFQIVDIQEIKDGTDEDLDFVNRKKLHEKRDLCLQLVLKKRTIDLQAQTPRDKQDMVDGLRGLQRKLQSRRP